MEITIRTTEETMTDSSTEGIKIVLHPVSDLAAASGQACAVVSHRGRLRPTTGYDVGAKDLHQGRWTARHDLTRRILARAGP